MISEEAFGALVEEIRPAAEARAGETSVLQFHRRKRRGDDRLGSDSSQTRTELQADSRCPRQFKTVRLDQGVP